MDGAPCAAPGHGAFERAAAAGAPNVLDAAIEGHGAPLSLRGGRGSAFCASGSSARETGGGEFEKRPKGLDIRHIEAHARHPQASGRLERMRGGPERRLHLSGGPSAARAARSAGGRPSHAGSLSCAKPASGPAGRFFHRSNFEGPS